jgi:hypothetical protein
MNKWYHLPAGLVLISLCSHLVANDSISFPKGPAAWNIKITDSPNRKTPSNATARLSEIDVTQSDEFRHSRITYADNQAKEFWSIVGSNLFLTEYPNGVVALNPTSRFFFVPFAPSSFDWIQPGCLQEKGPVEYQEKKCFHYKGPMGWSPTTGASGMPTSAGGSVTLTTGEAWVDSKTLLPVAFDDGQILAVFTFHAPPTTPLVPPAKFLGLYEKYKIVNGIPKN